MTAPALDPWISCGLPPGQRRLVLTRAELAAGGVTRGRLAAQLAAGRWRALGSHVVVLHNGPLTGGQARWAAVLHAGPRAALCAWSAAQAGGLRGWERSGIHLLVPRGRRPAPLPEPTLHVHESRRWDGTDLHPARLPPMTRLERSAIDAAAWSENPRAACGLLAAVVQQRLASASSLQAELRRAGQVGHAGVLRRALADIAGGAQALTEIDFARFCRRHGLPAPEHQVLRRDASGRRRYLDITLRSRSGRMVHIEIDGAVHQLPTSYWADMRRHNELVLGDARLLRFPTIALYLEPETVLAQVRRALAD